MRSIQEKLAHCRQLSERFRQFRSSRQEPIRFFDTLAAYGIACFGTSPATIPAATDFRRPSWPGLKSRCLSGLRSRASASPQPQRQTGCCHQADSAAALALRLAHARAIASAPKCPLPGPSSEPSPWDSGTRDRGWRWVQIEGGIPRSDPGHVGKDRDGGGLRNFTGMLSMTFQRSGNGLVTEGSLTGPRRSSRVLRTPCVTIISNRAVAQPG